MRLISTDPDEPGIFAFGQFAYGVVAIGQVATGIFTIGQLSIGVIAVGQGATGLIAVGQGAVGLLYAVAMVGVGARGFGGVLPLLPGVKVQRFERPELPPLSPLVAFERESAGHLLAQIKDGKIYIDDRPLSVELSHRAVEQLARASELGHNFACLTLRVQTQLHEDAAAYRAPVEQTRTLRATELTTWFEGRPRLRLEGSFIGPGWLVARVLLMVAAGSIWWFFMAPILIGLFA